MTQDKKLELIGTAGVSYTRIDAKASALGVSASDDDSEFGVRIGAGAQYGITDSINVRGIARFQTADFDGATDNAWQYTLGVNYKF